MVPFDTYKTYLALKNHFTKDSYDYHKYQGKSRASLQSFYKRKDRYWFEKLSRQKEEKDVIDFFVANFTTCSDPQTLWIGEIIKEGEVGINLGKEKYNLFPICLKKNLSNYLMENLKKFLIVLRDIHPF